MPVVAIAVVADNGVIGDGTDQPFKIPEDWRRFKRVTMGHPLVMGRRTYQAVGLLPGRPIVVITSDPGRVSPPESIPEGSRLLVAGSLDQALALAGGMSDTVYVAGGGRVFAEAMDRLDILDLTEVHAPAEGSVLFPPIDPQVWVETSRDPRDGFDFVTYRRRR